MYNHDIHTGFGGDLGISQTENLTNICMLKRLHLVRDFWTRPYYRNSSIIVHVEKVQVDSGQGDLFSIDPPGRSEPEPGAKNPFSAKTASSSVPIL